MKKLLLFFVFFISLNTLAGPKVFRTDEGMLYVENVKNNKKEGKYTYYLKDGYREEGTYKNGVLEGPDIIYFKDGQIAIKGNYINGKLDGPYKKYYKNLNKTLGRKY